MPAGFSQLSQKLQRLPFMLGLTLVLMLVFIIYQTPARWALPQLQKLVPGLALEDVEGRLWNGQSSYAELRHQGRGFALGELHWRISPLSLLRLSPCAEIEAQYLRQQLQGVICAHPDGSWSARSASLQGPGALLEFWLPLTLDGELSVQVQHLRVEAERVTQLQADAGWRDARIHSGQDWLPLGTLASRWRTDETSAVIGEVFDIDGPLGVNLQFSSPDQHSLAVSGSLQPRATAHQLITRFLQATGFPQEQGSFKISWNQP